MASNPSRLCRPRVTRNPIDLEDSLPQWVPKWLLYPPLVVTGDATIKCVHCNLDLLKTQVRVPLAATSYSRAGVGRLARLKTQVKLFHEWCAASIESCKTTSPPRITVRHLQKCLYLSVPSWATSLYGLGQLLRDLSSSQDLQDFLCAKSEHWLVSGIVMSSFLSIVNEVTESQLSFPVRWPVLLTSINHKQAIKACIDDDNRIEVAFAPLT